MPVLKINRECEFCRFLIYVFYLGASQTQQIAFGCE
uniref:Uncharacterized protein n=1 Tax=Arundo donax TaxID=35708 RepID=A0A0A9AX98_ARUDO